MTSECRGPPARRGYTAGSWPPAGVRRQLRRGRGGALLAALAALVAVPLDLAAELVGDQVDRVVEVPRRVLRAQGDALQVQRRLGHHVLGVGRVALLADLDLEHGQVGLTCLAIFSNRFATCSRSSSVTGRLRPLTSIRMGLLSYVPAVGLPSDFTGLHSVLT